MGLIDVNSVHTKKIKDIKEEIVNHYIKHVYNLYTHQKEYNSINRIYEKSKLF